MHAFHLPTVEKVKVKMSAPTTSRPMESKPAPETSDRNKISILNSDNKFKMTAKEEQYIPITFGGTDQFKNIPILDL